MHAVQCVVTRNTTDLILEGRTDNNNRRKTTGRVSTGTLHFRKIHNNQKGDPPLTTVRAMSAPLPHHRIDRVISGDLSTPMKTLLVRRSNGIVKWLNSGEGRSFVNQNDTCDVVFVLQSTITRNNSYRINRSVGESETVKFEIVLGDEERGAAYATGSIEEPAQDRPYAMDRRRFWSHWAHR